MEAWNDAQLAETIKGARTLTGAVRKLGPVIGVYADRQADAVISSGEAPGKPAAQKTSARKPAATLPEDFPGRAKVMRLVEGGPEHGWTAALSDIDPATGAATVVVTRGEESFKSDFIGGNSAGYSFHTQPGGKVRRLNNVSAVLHVMAGLGSSGHPLPAPAATPPRQRTRPRPRPRPPARRARAASSFALGREPGIP